MKKLGFYNFYTAVLKWMGFCPFDALVAEKNRSARLLDESVSLAIELSGLRHTNKVLREDVERLTRENNELRRDLDNMSKDLMLAARSESMAVERAWHAGELVKLLRARLDLQMPPRGVETPSSDA